jgi:hemerythrin-like domain-containing protein
VTTNLALESRSALPDDIAYLRAPYPRAGWREHLNFGELSNFWLQVHDHLRKQGGHLEQLTTEFREGRANALHYRNAFVPGLSHFLQHLNGHHQIEDLHYFPKFRALDSRMAAGFDLLDQDHRRIHDALLASAGAANQFLSSFERGQDALRHAGDAYAGQADRLLSLLLRHLADEEDLVIPAMLHHGERHVS